MRKKQNPRIEALKVKVQRVKDAVKGKWARFAAHPRAFAIVGVVALAMVLGMVMIFSSPNRGSMTAQTGSYKGPGAATIEEPAKWRTIDYSKTAQSDHLAKPWACLKDKNVDVEKCKGELIEYTRHDPDILAVNLAEFNLIPGQNKLDESAPDYSTKLEKLRTGYAQKLADWQLRKQQVPRLEAVLDSLKNVEIVPMSGDYYTVGKDHKTGELTQEQITMDPTRHFALEGTDYNGRRHTVKGDCGGQPSSRIPLRGYHHKHKHHKPPPRHRCPWPLTNGKCLQPKNPNEDPQRRGNVPEQVKGKNPPVEGNASAPKVEKPTKPYTPPPPPPAPDPPKDSTPEPDPEPPPPPEPDANPDDGGGNSGDPGGF